MEDVEHRDPTPEDARALALGMRAADEAECWAASGMPTYDAVVASVEASAECKALYLHGEFAGIWGVVPYDAGCPGRHGIGWMLTTYAVERHPGALIAATWDTFPGLLERWDTLTNHIDCRHVQALKWGLRVGFRFSPPELFGHERRPFCRFIVRKEDLLCATPQS